MLCINCYRSGRVSEGSSIPEETPKTSDTPVCEPNIPKGEHNNNCKDSCGRNKILRACVICGESISEGRLKAMPLTNVCINCANEHRRG